MTDFDRAMQNYLSGRATTEEKDYLLDQALKALNEIRTLAELAKIQDR